MKRDCKQCGEVFSPPMKEVNRGNGWFCAHSCSAAWGNTQRGGPVTGSGYRAQARRLYIEAYGIPYCTICGKVNADVHHQDEDYTNNHLDNLLPLCRSHHTTYHNMHGPGQVRQ